MGWIKDNDRDSPRKYEYKPGWDTTVDYCPDHRRSSSGCWFFDHGQTVGCVLEIKDDIGTVLGALILEGEADPEDPLGKIQHGVAVFSIDQIRYT